METIALDAGAGRKPISPYIYGMNAYGMAGNVAGFLQEIGLPLRRWGGNLSSRYNWQNDISNHGRDWFFNNSQQSDAVNVPGDSAAIRQMLQDRAAAAQTLLCVPTIGFVAKNQAAAWGFSVQKYGPQRRTAAGDGRPDAGDGVRPDGSLVAGNDPADTSVPADPAFVEAWIKELVGRFGGAAAGGIQFYGLDNEPDIWFDTHRDIFPLALTYDELCNRAYDYAAAVKRGDPDAAVLGPSVMGWTYYWHSPRDGQEERWGDRPDRMAHGDVPLLEWYLQQMAAYEQANGARILDYLDLHYYPASDGVSLAERGDATTAALRLRSTRSLWDPGYVDESWIAGAGPDGGVIRLIPRMREWVANNYPGTRLAISEYNWGALDDMNGALAQADVLGIFGREGLDLAALWQPPLPDDPGAYAFRIYLNYDGAGSRFGDISIQAISSDEGTLAAYAAQLSATNDLTLVVINKTAAAQSAQITLGNFNPGAAAAWYSYSAANLAAIVPVLAQPLAAAAFPPESITLIRIPSV